MGLAVRRDQNHALWMGARRHRVLPSPSSTAPPRIRVEGGAGPNWQDELLLDVAERETRDDGYR